MRVDKNMPDQWAIMVLYGFGAHSLSIKALNMFLEFKIKVIRMPSHTSSALQPLDVAVFQNCQAELPENDQSLHSTEEHDRWRIINQKIRTSSNFSRVLEGCYLPATIKSSFFASQDKSAFVSEDE
jgi:hypothetical protein